MTDLDALAEHVAEEAVDYDAGPAANASYGARAMLAKLREMGLVVEGEIRDSFVNELGNHIEIIIRGPSSESTNIPTQMEAERLSAALAAKLPRGPGHD